MIPVPNGWATGDRSRQSGQRLWRPVLYENVNFKLPAGRHCRVIGPNGAGKTTCLAHVDRPGKADAGTLKVGSTVQLGYVDSRATRLIGQDRLSGNFRRAPTSSQFGKTKINARAYCGHLPSKAATSRRRSASFPRRTQPRPPGQDAAFRAPPPAASTNPNDLDVETLRALESALEEFAGCAMIISHDRWFWTASPPTCGL